MNQVVRFCHQPARARPRDLLSRPPGCILHGTEVLTQRQYPRLGCCRSRRTEAVTMSSITSTIPMTKSTPFTPPGLRRITVDEYERIIRAGALNDPERVELIDGYLVDKMGKSVEHGYATKKIVKALEALFPAGWAWRSEQPVRIPNYDEPEPDVIIVRGTDED